MRSNFTSNTLSGSGSSPSTRESVTGVASEGEVQVQRGTIQSENATETQDTDSDSTTQVVDAQDLELIKVIVLEVHVVSDPGLRIPIE